MTQQPPFGNVLVGVDGTPTGLIAIALGARLCSPGGRLTLGNIVLTTSPTYRNFSPPRFGARGARCSNASVTQFGWSPS